MIIVFLFRDLQVVEPSEKIPPSELDENWMETTMEAINRPPGEKPPASQPSALEKEGGDVEKEEKDEAEAAGGDQAKDKSVWSVLVKSYHQGQGQNHVQHLRQAW